MLALTITPAPAGSPDLVHIRNLETEVSAIVPGRPAAVDWLIAHGCCRVAAHKLLDARYWELYTINGSSDAYQAL